ncbi:MAG: hypothetical protein J2P25_09025, partial [Nocardiopsaceae bacterium]|nr:hypothetical protein [Nocardiopsaceae bacterium]
SFVPPPGAKRLSAAPGADGGVLHRPAGIPRTPDVVDDASWWHVPQSPKAVLAWEKAHLPKRFKPTGSGTMGNTTGGRTNGGPGGTTNVTPGGADGISPSMWYDQYSLPPVVGALTQRQLTVEAVNAGHGQADLRVDAQDIWLPAKPASERVPSAAKVVTISVNSTRVANSKVPAPKTITNAATVRRIAALVDGLHPSLPGAYSCPADFGDEVQMLFRASAGGRPLATVSAAVDGCQGVSFTAGGKSEPTLAGGGTLAKKVLAAAGLHWSGYTGGPPMPGGSGASTHGGGASSGSGASPGGAGGGVNPGGVMQPGTKG